MGIRVAYEWDIEQWERDECASHDHSETLIGEHAVLARAGGVDRDEDSGDSLQLVLVRDTYTEAEGVLDREWAYIVDGVLPEYFSDAYGKRGARVPRKLRREFNAQTTQVASGLTSQPEHMT